MESLGQTTGLGRLLPKPGPVIAQKVPYAVELKPGDRYWRACEQSKNQPFCNGSHKVTSFTPTRFTAAEQKTVCLCGCRHTATPLSATEATKACRRARPRPPLPKGVRNVRDVHLLGRLVHVAETPAGPRAVAKGELVKPEAVERYLRGRFGDAFDAVRTEMEHLASGFPPERLNHEGLHLYEQFRPEVPPDERGWGAKGVLDVAKIRPLGQCRSARSPCA